MDIPNSPIGVKDLSNKLSGIVRDHLYQYGSTTITVSGIIKHEKNSKELQIKSSPRFGSYLSFSLIDKSEANSNEPKYTINVWQGNAKMIEGLQYGVEVEIIGTVIISSKNSNYYISAKNIIITDKKAIEHILQQRKEDFAKKGYFAKSISPYQLGYNPKQIGIVTSRDGSVIHDMATTLNARYPLCKIILYSCGVQGDDKAAQTIADGIKHLDSMGLDAIIVARGGGSAKDLMVFSNEIVVKAIYEAKTYIISAIGHQDDRPLCDLAANWRSATPTAAIDDVIAYNQDSLKLWLSSIPAGKSYLHHMIDRKSTEASVTINLHNYFNLLMSRIESPSHDMIQHKICGLSTEVNGLINVINTCQHNKIATLMHLVSNYKGEQLHLNMVKYVDNLHCTLTHTNDVIHAYSYTNTIDRGFCLIMNDENAIITTKADFVKMDKKNCRIKFKDGECHL